MLERYVARQPIFDRQNKVFGYEMLFRNSLENYFSGTDGDVATSSVLLNTFDTIGIKTLTNGKPTFINFTKDLLLGRYATLFPKDQVIIEILEEIEPSEEVLQAIRDLKEQGFTIALDDFVFKEELLVFVELADIIKIDFTITSFNDQQVLMNRFANRGIKFLAEKVETNEEHQKAMDMGYEYFQGYFFSKPSIYTGRDIPVYKFNHLRLLSDVNQATFSFSTIEKTVSQDLSLSFKLLRFINSAYFGLPRKVNSIKHALVLLGEREVRKWISLLAMAGMGEDKPVELIVYSTLRAKYCELLAEKIGMNDSKSDMFLLGMFSMIDAILDKSKEEILKDLPLPNDIKFALLGGENKYKEVFDSTVAYEKGEWEKLKYLSDKLHLPGDEIPDLYLDSVDWTNKIFKGNLL